MPEIVPGKKTCGECEYHPCATVPPVTNKSRPECPARTNERKLLKALEEAHPIVRAASAGAYIHRQEASDALGEINRAIQPE